MPPVCVRTSSSASSPRRNQRRQRKIVRQARGARNRLRSQALRHFPGTTPESRRGLSRILRRVEQQHGLPRPAGKRPAQPSPPARNALPRTTPLKEIRSCSAAQQREDSIPKRSAPSPPFLLYDSFRCKNCLTLRTHRVSRQLPLRNFFQHNQLPYGKTTPGASFCHEKNSNRKGLTI